MQVNPSGQPLNNQALWIARADPHGNEDRPAWSQFPLTLQAAGGGRRAAGGGRRGGSLDTRGEHRIGAKLC
ncbi:hypothetical protein BCAR13_280002 [Paraburkholderia caribensis]|uniref:hypothetical protein n=1 Tax=Paraburkholderia caribensis TaxID=75105 RepID=UPI001CB0103C|nr:hypothetical protein [Paraburkholderia caribensis]CAG9213540.1 hypothetical protein BCAR13_280002 [Paraburkholderia caribensis]